MNVWHIIVYKKTENHTEYTSVQNGAWSVHRPHGTLDVALHLAYICASHGSFVGLESIQDLSVVGAAIT